MQLEKSFLPTYVFSFLPSLEGCDPVVRQLQAEGELAGPVNDSKANLTAFTELWALQTVLHNVISLSKRCLIISCCCKHKPSLRIPHNDLPGTMLPVLLGALDVP